MADILTSSLTDRVKAKLAFDEKAFSQFHEHTQTVGEFDSAVWENARLQPLLTQLLACVEAMELNERQIHGIENCWAGAWMTCKCRRIWVYGGNWNDCEPTEICPTCKMREALTALEESLKEMG